MIIQNIFKKSKKSIKSIKSKNIKNKSLSRYKTKKTVKLISLNKNNKSSKTEHKSEYKYFVGDFVNTLLFIELVFTSNQITINLYNKNGYIFNYKDNSFTTYPEKIIKTLKYNYNSLYISENNIQAKEIKYNNLPIDIKKYNRYILVNLESNKYLSLGFSQFEFNTPDNDTIITACNGNSGRSGSQMPYLIGNKYTYYIDSDDYLGFNFYISNDVIKKYDLPSNPHLYIPEYDSKIKKYYIKYSNKKDRKILGIKYTSRQDERLYDVINELKVTNIF